MQELVSIIVITYNSEEFIIETLESIKKQTYKNIELIISDDCSEDSTVEICQDWLDRYNVHFFNCECITSSKNTGLTKNLNRGCKVAHGEWLKPIAGDDILLKTCIDDNLNHCTGTEILFSKVETFSENDVLGYSPANNIVDFFDLDSTNQFARLFIFNFLPAPALFINAQYLNKIGYFDERYSMMEDYPLWLKATYTGHKLHYFSDVTVRYRIHDKSISNTVDVFYNTKIHALDKQLIQGFIKEYKVGLCLRINRFFQFFMRDKVIENGNDRKAFIRYQYIRYFNPCQYIFKVNQLLKNIMKKLYVSSKKERSFE